MSSTVVSDSPARSEPAPQRRERGRLIPEIQLLRALAVLGVVVFHLWPGRLSGGFAGVDVFFVISGYLITSHLTRQLTTSGRIKLGQFYGRRIRRLLPAATVTTVFVLIVTWLYVPAFRWQEIFGDAIASSLYFLNIRLATQSVDYFAAHTTASPLQHYWSLSVEEQFYLVWPVLLLAVYALARVTGLAGKRSLIGLVIALGALSLAFSIWYTGYAPAPAYLVTPTRIWEFCAGAVVALWLSASPRLSRTPRWLLTVLSATGFAMIAISFLVLTESMPFPGWIALVPVAGTALVILVSTQRRERLFHRMADLRVVHFLGDTSYSVYLWHWPIIILFPYVVGAPPGTAAKVGLLVLAVLLAAATRRLIERPFIETKRLGRAAPIVVLIGCLALTVVPSGITLAANQAQLSAARDSVDKLLGSACFAAAASLSDCPVSHTVKPEYGPTFATADSDSSYDACMVSDPNTTEVKTCTFGPKDAKFDVALVGDSHAGELMPPLIDLAEHNGWRVTTMLRGLCPVMDRSNVETADSPPDACATWSDAVQKRVAEGPFQAVVTSGFMAVQTDAYVSQGRDPNLLVKSLTSTWKAWADSGKRVIAVASTPRTGPEGLGRNVPDCVAQSPTVVDPCTLERALAVPRDPTTVAASQMHDAVDLVDLTPVFCDVTTCHTVVGGLVAYRDESHLTVTFARSLEPWFAKPLEGLANR